MKRRHNKNKNRPVARFLCFPLRSASKHVGYSGRSLVILPYPNSSWDNTLAPMRNNNNHCRSNSGSCPLLGECSTQNRGAACPPQKCRVWGNTHANCLKLAILQCIHTSNTKLYMIINTFLTINLKIIYRMKEICKNTPCAYHLPGTHPATSRTLPHRVRWYLDIRVIRLRLLLQSLLQLPAHCPCFTNEDTEERGPCLSRWMIKLEPE